MRSETGGPCLLTDCSHTGWNQALQDVTNTSLDEPFHAADGTYRPPLWLGPRGAFTANGIYQLVQARGLEAGLGRIHPHQFRHTFAHRWQMLGLSESDLMSLAGWSSRQMLKRYASSAASERALESYDRAGFGDDI